LWDKKTKNTQGKSKKRNLELAIFNRSCPIETKKKPSGKTDGVGGEGKNPKTGRQKERRRVQHWPGMKCAENPPYERENFNDP